MRFTRRIAMLVALSAAAIGGISTTASAVAVPPIIDGETAPPTAWAVQLKPVGCTGSQINDSWILTARHCVEEGTLAYHSNSTASPGPGSPIDKQVIAPQGDVALLHMRDPFPLGEYPQLDLNFTAQNSGTGTIMGYGRRANGTPSDGLYQAQVNLTGQSTDAYSGLAQHLTGTNGAANHGDSGGPLLVGNKIVAVCSTGDESDPGANPHASSNYALLSQTDTWITDTISTP